mgnify:CR=1 FL=1
MKKHPRQRGYFGDTVRKGASGPARPGKKNARRTDDEQTFVSVPGGLDAEEVLGLMGKIRHPVRLDDLIGTRNRLRTCSTLCKPKAGSSGFAAANGWRRRKPGS